MKRLALRERARRGVRGLLTAEGPPPQLSIASWQFDLLLGAAVTALSLIQAWKYSNGDALSVSARPVALDKRGFLIFSEPQPVSRESVLVFTAFALLGSVPLIWRRRRPLAVYWLVVGAELGVNGNLHTIGFVAAVIAAYSAVVYSPYRIAALAGQLVGAALVSGLLSSAIPNLPSWAGAFAVLVPLALGGNAIRQWRSRAQATVQRMHVMEQEAQETTRRALESERARIARELHDVVTHNVSVMVVQAGAARKVMDRSPEQATEALLAVEASGRAAMAELRQVMGLLNARTDGLGPDRAQPDAADGADGTELDQADLAPQPGLEQLDTLVGRVRDTGVAVTLTVTGAPRPVPPGIGLAAYRTVQEALTNTVKHAVGASAEVTVGYGPRALRLEIADTGGTASPAAATGNGRGLIGLRERLAVYGGSLETARRPTGGFRVRAVIPLTGPEAP